MTAREVQSCPLCAGSATFLLFDYGHRKTFECAACGQFVITVTAEQLLSKPPGAREAQLSTLSKTTGATEITEVRTENAPSGGKQIVATRLLRSSVRLP